MPKTIKERIEADRVKQIAISTQVALEEILISGTTTEERLNQYLKQPDLLLPSISGTNS